MCIFSFSAFCRSYKILNNTQFKKKLLFPLSQHQNILAISSLVLLKRKKVHIRANDRFYFNITFMLSPGNEIKHILSLYQCKGNCNMQLYQMKNLISTSMVSLSVSKITANSLMGFCQACANDIKNLIILYQAKRKTIIIEVCYNLRKNVVFFQLLRNSQHLWTTNLQSTSGLQTSTVSPE